MQMPFGRLVVLKRTGGEGGNCPMNENTLMIGRYTPPDVHIGHKDGARPPLR